MIRRRVYVTGLVQGVYYRDTCRRVAEDRGVAGWVRNRQDLRVEAVFEGEPDPVEALVAWCREGPRGARVTGVEVLEEEPIGEVAFEIRW
jgi:acylphosphatase